MKQRLIQHTFGTIQSQFRLSAYASQAKSVNIHLQSDVLKFSLHMLQTVRTGKFSRSINLSLLSNEIDYNRLTVNNDFS